MKFLTEDDTAEIDALERRLTDFYASTSEYTPFSHESRHVDMWTEIVRHLRTSPGRTLRVLELGAGKSGLGKFLAECDGALRQRVHLCCQDVTESNRVHLESQCNEVFVGPMEEIGGSWDVITHAYVFEHVVRPRRFLGHAIDLLADGGLHIFQCPRYDVPFYAPPALDHLPPVQRLRAMVAILWVRRDFLLVGDPAVFHMPFHRDRDAVHVVSKAAVWRACRGRVRLDEFGVAAGGARDYVLKKLLTLRVRMVKDG